MPLDRLKSGQAEARDRRLAILLIERGILEPEDALSALAGAPPGRFAEALVQSDRLSQLLCDEVVQELRRREVLGEPRLFPLPEEVAEAARTIRGRVTKYLLLQRVGAGGSGEVWKAWDTQLRRYVALKFLKGWGQKETQRLQREAALLAHLSHPGIVPIYEIGGIPDEPFLALEYLDGGSLEGSPRDPRRAAEIVRDAARAVHHAHEQGIIHRDLKPANLMETTDGRVYVTDFGLARLVEPGTTLTREGALVGTPSYMSPEQVRGDRCTPRTDIYGLGATLYSLLEGRAPFTGADVTEVLRRIQEEEPSFTHAPTDLATVIRKAMAREPSARHATALELAEELDRVLPSLQTAAPASEVVEPPQEVTTLLQDPRSVHGKYVCVLRLGSGGGGEVWKAWDRELHRWVALKFPHRDNPEDLPRLLEEARAAAKLNHPNIGAVYEVGDIGGRPFIAMQYIDGRTLAEFPRDDRKLLAELIRDTALALHHAHEQGVIHRDLKPHNLIVEGELKPRKKSTHRVPGLTRASGLRVYVVDFGLAREVSVEAPGSLEGTPAYMSPEQIRGGLRGTEARSDVYSLGATLYELLANRPLFRADPIYELLQKIATKPPTPPRRFDSSIDRDLETIVLKCLEKDPSQRYASMLDLADDLSRYLDGEAILAHRPSLLYRWRKTIARHMAILLPVGTAGLLAVGLAVWVGVQRIREHRRIENHLSEGRALEARGDLAGARRAFAAAVALNGNHEEALRNLARLERAIAAREESDRRRLEQARSLFESGRPALEEATQSFYDANATYDQIVARVDRGQTLIEKGVGLAPELAVGHYLLGRAWEFKGWEDRAERAYREALLRDPSFGSALFFLGRLLLHRSIALNLVLTSSATSRRREQAQEVAREAAERIGAALRVGMGLEGESQVRIAQAMVAFYEGNWDRIPQILGELRASRGAEEAYLLVALCNGDSSKRRGICDIALGIRPHDPLLLFVRAIAQEELRDEPRALEDYTHAVRFSPRFLPVYRNRAVLLQRTGKLDEAIRDSDAEIELDPNSASAYSVRGDGRRLRGERWMREGRAAEAKGEWTQAETDFNRSIALDPQDAGVLNQRGMLYRLLGKLEEAIADYTRAIDLPKPKASYYFNRANARVDRYDRFPQREDAESALKDFAKAIELDPRHSGAYLNRGNLRAKRKEYDPALEDFTTAISLAPEDPGPHLSRATLRAMLRDETRALRDVERALELAPRDWIHRPRAEKLRDKLRTN